ncbi:MAG: NAD-dependent epimerase/dehydratase family protein [Nitrososphaerota archaeon]|jgi:nucleoside-diphosphate-sugar epimerase|nr:NAD-dependent epimerase/dehydratase family protein [Nitrososphaerota archaeon]MDG6956835.1 NAD-dependent epimerase/dehydratase family protein [Nitrososphaerota archaeon]MDG6965458.1 NAD-dependent epimerase/dehydratase family protein [Nitrososphaerota archaeon]MDG7014891.1 NAD-dependent epimerase/dehydratase family protein [Nitrososphaerota archaeon]WGO50852.1 MAG: NAD-dependent epimerase/dehydratase family protein [Nitrososphaerota archaeon]
MGALVTGGAGSIGSHVVDRLPEEGCEVTAVDKLASLPVSSAHLMSHSIATSSKV